jgi:hypothetical protein
MSSKSYHSSRSKTHKRSHHSTSKRSHSEVDEWFTEFTKHQVIMKLFHFQTKAYGGHKTSDSYLSKFLENMDKFMEVAQGIYGRVDLKHFDICGNVISDSSITHCLTSFGKYLESMTDRIKCTDLLSIRDEMLGEVNQFKYLLTFK